MQIADTKLDAGYSFAVPADPKRDTIPAIAGARQPIVQNLSRIGSYRQAIAALAVAQPVPILQSVIFKAIGGPNRTAD